MTEASGVKGMHRPKIYGWKAISTVIGHFEVPLYLRHIDNNLEIRPEEKFVTKIAASNDTCTSCYIHFFKRHIIFEIMGMK
jgi:hypothetical protein